MTAAALIRASLFSLVLAVAGCGTTLRVSGPGEADVFLTIPPGAKDLSLVGRQSAGGALKYKLPPECENQKLYVIVKSDRGAWRYTVFSDRDVAVEYPPKGTLAGGIGAVEALLPDAPPTAPAPAAASSPAPAKSTKALPPTGAGAGKPSARPGLPGAGPRPPDAPRPSQPDAPEEPSASVSPD